MNRQRYAGQLVYIIPIKTTRYKTKKIRNKPTVNFMVIAFINLHVVAIYIGKISKNFKIRYNKHVLDIKCIIIPLNSSFTKHILKNYKYHN